MKKVQLFVQDKNSGRRDFVQGVMIPDFIVPPDVIIWGSRTFKHLVDDSYIECFAVVAIQTEDQFAASTAKDN